MSKQVPRVLLEKAKNKDIAEASLSRPAAPSILLPYHCFKPSSPSFALLQPLSLLQCHPHEIALHRPNPCRLRMRS